MVHYGSANRDEDVFACPAHYDPRREGLNRHVAFGKGVHFCIGAPLARPSSASRSRCSSSGCRGSGSPAGRSGGSRSSSRGAWSGSTSNGIPRDDPGHSTTTGRTHHGETMLADRPRGGRRARRGAGRSHGRNRRADATTVSIDYATSFGNFGRDAYVYVAMEKGYFEQAGFDVNVTPGTGSVDNIKLVAAGRLDYTPVDIGALMVTRANEGLAVRTSPSSTRTRCPRCSPSPSRTSDPRRRSRARRSRTRLPRPCACSSRSTRRRPGSTRRR